MQLMLQATVYDCLSFDPFAFEEERLSAPEVDVSRGKIVEALVIAGRVVMRHEAATWRSSRGASIVFETALKAELACVLEDEFAVAGLVAVELNAGFASDQGLKKGFALDERQT